MIWSRPQYLSLCEKMHTSGYRPDFEEGNRVGRRFADLGVEEFVVLPGRRLLSLFTGDITTSGDRDAEFFFHIPSVSELLSLLGDLGARVSDMRYVDNRSWNVNASSSCHSVVAEEDNLEEALAEACLSFLMQAQDYVQT